MEEDDWRKEIELARLDVDRARLALDQTRTILDQQQLENERHRLFLERWNADLGPQHRYVVEAERGALALSQSGIKSLFILNGGALLLLPTAYSLLHEISLLSKSQVLNAATYFAVGLFFIATASLFAYLAQSAVSRQLSEGITWRAIKLNKPNLKDEELEQDSDYKKAKVDGEKFRNFFNKFAWTALGLSALSLVMFAAGVLIALSGSLPN